MNATAGTADRLRIVVVDDHLLFRAGVRSELAAHCTERETAARHVRARIQAIIVDQPHRAITRGDLPMPSRGDKRSR